MWGKGCESKKENIWKSSRSVERWTGPARIMSPSGFENKLGAGINRKEPQLPTRQHRTEGLKAQDDERNRESMQQHLKICCQQDIWQCIFSTSF